MGTAHTWFGLVIIVVTCGRRTRKVQMGKSENNQRNGRQSTSTKMNDWIRSAFGYVPAAAGAAQPEEKRKIPTANAGTGAHAVVEVPVNVNQAMNAWLRNRGRYE